MIDFLAANVVARIAFLALVFGVVAYSVYMIYRLIQRRAAVKGDLQAIGLNKLGGSQRVSLQDRRESAWTALADKIESAGLSLEDSKADQLRDKLKAAGFASPAAPRIFTLLRLILVFALPLGWLALASSSNQEISDLRLYGLGLALALFGLYGPSLFISAKADRRRQEITNGFPDCLDLMLVCVEAGLGLEASMDRVGREMVASHPLVSQILSEATLQLRAGATREDAMRKMGESSGVDEIRSFSTLLIQSDKLGTSVADTLRVYANEMREKRRLRAEEKAHRLPVLISIPLVICMLPTMIGVLMMPGVIRTFRELLPALTGG